MNPASGHRYIRCRRLRGGVVGGRGRHARGWPSAQNPAVIATTANRKAAAYPGRLSMVVTASGPQSHVDPYVLRPG